MWGSNNNVPYLPLDEGATSENLADAYNSRREAQTTFEQFQQCLSRYAPSLCTRETMSHIWARFSAVVSRSQLWIQAGPLSNYTQGQLWWALVIIVLQVFTQKLVDDPAFLADEKHSARFGFFSDYLLLFFVIVMFVSLLIDHQFSRFIQPTDSEAATVEQHYQERTNILLSAPAFLWAVLVVVLLIEATGNPAIYALIPFNSRDILDFMIDILMRCYNQSDPSYKKLEKLKSYLHAPFANTVASSAAIGTSLPLAVYTLFNVFYNGTHSEPYPHMNEAVLISMGFGIAIGGGLMIASHCASSTPKLQTRLQDTSEIFEKSCKLVFTNPNIIISFMAYKNPNILASSKLFSKKLPLIASVSLLLATYSLLNIVLTKKYPKMSTLKEEWNNQGKLEQRLQAHFGSQTTSANACRSGCRDILLYLSRFFEYAAKRLVAWEALCYACQAKIDQLWQDLREEEPSSTQLTIATSSV